MLSWPTLAVLLIAKLCVAQQVVLRPVSRVEPSCYGCAAVLEVFFAFCPGRLRILSMSFWDRLGRVELPE